MLRQFIKDLQGVDLFGIISTLIFFGFFTLIVIHTLKMKKEDDSRYCRLPLEDNDQVIQNDQDNIKN